MCCWHVMRHSRLGLEQGSLGGVRCAPHHHGGARLYMKNGGWIAKDNYREYIAMNGYSSSKEVVRLSEGARDTKLKNVEKKGLMGSERPPYSHKWVKTTPGNWYALNWMKVSAACGMIWRRFFWKVQAIQVSRKYYLSNTDTLTSEQDKRSSKDSFIISCTIRFLGETWLTASKVQLQRMGKRSARGYLINRSKRRRACTSFTT